ncbi:DUF6249 domain-containing protein [Prevotella sp. KH2C16]|uniref:DUF6249 domain-containing protein n=1 Tax=Prevotella sp. KH2C16 TaxID=1855325 RepID=UPI0008F34D6D|nr:DUF6249 domain-containing protein [Prevotella sp. KH2C16]SFG32717.1 hypothetical protein SAMN05216383_11031 [Prevotella sp. KH2C16]
MKQTLIALALMLTLSATQMDAAPKHRHHAQVTTVDKDTVKQDGGIEAFSDTTSTSASETQDSIIEESQSRHYGMDTDFDDGDFNIFGLRELLATGGGIALAAFVFLIIFLFLLFPFIVILLVLRYLVKRHNDRVALAEKAMESGQAIPEAMKPVDKQSVDYLYKRGIRNIAIGVGLFIMFYIWGSSTLAGVGALIACYGLGQLAISRSSKKQDTKDNEF